MKKLNLKGQMLNQLSALGIGIVTLTITLVIVFLLMSNLAANTTVAADGNATATISTAVAAVDDIPGWLGIIVITVIGALLLALIRFFKS